jgi:2-haloalkanoic acid dehalogenase type II
LLTFDCYGTLINWEDGPREVFEEILASKGADVPVERFRERWEKVQFGMVEHGPYRPYREVLTGSIAEALGEFGLEYEEEDGEAFLGAFVSFGPFPEVRAALQRLGERYELGIISNTDHDLISRSIENIGIHFDHVTTAEDAGAYKPGPGLFELALQKAGAERSEVVHVFAGYKYDMVPARRMGLPTVWVNRKGEEPPGDLAPDRVVASLGDVYELLEPERAAGAANGAKPRTRR